MNGSLSVGHQRNRSESPEGLKLHHLVLPPPSKIVKSHLHSMHLHGFDIVLFNSLKKGQTVPTIVENIEHQ